MTMHAAQQHSTRFFHLIFTLILVLLLTACDGGGGGGGTTPINNALGGGGHKGAFLAGANVTAYQLNTAASRAGGSVSTTVSDNRGGYTLAPTWTGWSEIEISDQFFDEYK
jgi:hypothetical protein